MSSIEALPAIDYFSEGYSGINLSQLHPKSSFSQELKAPEARPKFADSNHLDFGDFYSIVFI